MNLNITSNIPVNCTNALREKASFMRSADEARQHPRVSAGAVHLNAMPQKSMDAVTATRCHLNVDPETTTICNCTDCRTKSGAPLRAIVITQPGTLVLLSGQPWLIRSTHTRYASERRDIEPSPIP